MNDIKIFENKDFGKINVLETNNGIYFKAQDVCRALDIKNTTDAIKRLDEDEVTRFNLGSLSGVTNFVNEYGLYSLVLASRKAEAKEFKRWVTHEVLPSIRKNGGYIQNQENLSDSELMAKALLVADKQIKERDRIIEEQKPKVLFANSVSESKNSILVGDLSKLIKQNGINIGRDRLFEWLRNNGYLGKKGLDYNKPTQKAMDLKLFELKPYTKVSPNGSIITYFTPYVTGKGQIYFINKFLGGENGSI